MTGTKPRLLELSGAAQDSLIAGARDTEHVSGLTHSFYRYPARFSPSFVRAAIATFTDVNDLVMDNHVGGGTTLVEALALGRDAIGIDISTLAEFVTSVKTTVLTEAELSKLENWARRLAQAIDLQKPSVRFADYSELGYYRHLDSPARWRLRKAIEQSIASAQRLRCARLEAFGRCVVLRTAQWALDSRKRLPSLPEFRARLVENAQSMITDARHLRQVVESNLRRPDICIIRRSAAGLETEERLFHLRAPRLVVTSPPYPGLHVLYHRWQVDGRKEAPLPFLIANKLDGAGSSFYTMGDRKYPELRSYFDNIRASMSSVAALADERTTVVQMVAFSESSWQLERYLQTMEEAGLSEVFLPALQSVGDGRLWRSVPNRRWYSDQRGETPGSQEVVFFHRKRMDSPKRPVRLGHLGPTPHLQGLPDSGSSAGSPERSRG